MLRIHFDGVLSERKDSAPQTCRQTQQPSYMHSLSLFSFVEWIESLLPVTCQVNRRRSEDQMIPAVGVQIRQTRESQQRTDLPHLVLVNARKIRGHRGCSGSSMFGRS